MRECACVPVKLFIKQGLHWVWCKGCSLLTLALELLCFLSTLQIYPFSQPTNSGKGPPPLVHGNIQSFTEPCGPDLLPLSSSCSVLRPHAMAVGQAAVIFRPDDCDNLWTSFPSLFLPCWHVKVPAGKFAHVLPLFSSLAPSPC